jgi:hypothetical protein
MASTNTAVSLCDVLTQIRQKVSCSLLDAQNTSQVPMVLSMNLEGMTQFPALSFSTQGDVEFLHQFLGSAITLYRQMDFQAKQKARLACDSEMMEGVRAIEKEWSDWMRGMIQIAPQGTQQRLDPRQLRASRPTRGPTPNCREANGSQPVSCSDANPASACQRRAGSAHPNPHIPRQNYFMLFPEEKWTDCERRANKNHLANVARGSRPAQGGPNRPNAGRRPQSCAPHSQVGSSEPPSLQTTLVDVQPVGGSETPAGCGRTCTPDA